MIKIETIKTWVSESVVLTAEPHSNYDSERAEETVKHHYKEELTTNVDDLEVECIDLDYNDDDSEVYRLIVSYILKPDCENDE